MNPNVSERRGAGRRRARAILNLAALAVAGAVAAALLLLPGSPARAAGLPADGRRLTRDIGVFEKVIDGVLLDSKNLLVYSTDHNTNGLYLDDFGVILSFQASLVDRPDSMSEFSFGRYRIEDKGDRIVVYKHDDKDAEGRKSDAAGAVALKTRDDKDEARLAGLYAAGKQELTDVLLDYGATLTGLRDDQYVAIAAFLKGSDYFQDRHISRLVIKAQVGDLRALAANQIGRDAMLAKVELTEY